MGGNLGMWLQHRVTLSFLFVTLPQLLEDSFVIPTPAPALWYISCPLAFCWHKSSWGRTMKYLSSLRTTLPALMHEIRPEMHRHHHEHVWWCVGLVGSQSGFSSFVGFLHLLNFPQLISLFEWCTFQLPLSIAHSHPPMAKPCSWAAGAAHAPVPCPQEAFQNGWKENLEAVLTLPIVLLFVLN